MTGAVDDALTYARRYWTFGTEPQSQSALKVLAAEVARLKGGEDRLREYAAAQRMTAEMMKTTAAQIEAVYPDSPTAALHDGARLLGLVADDLDKLLAGEELKRWRIEGEVG